MLARVSVAGSWPRLVSGSGAEVLVGANALTFVRRPPVPTISSLLSR